MAWPRRLVYRIYRHPAFLFGVAPAFLFLIQYRVPFGLMRSGWQPWLSTMGTNLAIAAFAALSVWLVGPVAFFAVHMPIVLMAATMGVWLFYVQHQYEDTFWARDPDWQFQYAALHGSSHYDLPPVLRWLTGHIGVHHVHHLASRVPFYRLPAVLRDHPELREVGRLTLADSLRCVHLVLWDEERRELLSFRQLRRRLYQGAPEPGFIATFARQSTALAQTVCALPVWLYLSLSPARSRR